ncbi:hypothetical protein PISL3812_00801 [Talaromyces islandicus]|uniref:Zn(2)-C6 fungal-type domain-containing protein n=1 Tax=Talaromyces islandicus TaxID=28573 RepID=A0A0U1LMC2_TALIS|nr:hypothetical protein PISL3812_00801 [Talaromyces islandicus]
MNSNSSSSDLLNRHATLHNADNDPSSKKRRRFSNAGTAARASQACGSCAENHLRCEDQKPCKRCIKRKIPCQVQQKSVSDVNIVTPTSMEQFGPAENEPVPGSENETSQQLRADLDRQLCDQFSHPSYKTTDPQLWLQNEPRMTAGNEQEAGHDLVPVPAQDYGGLLAPEPLDLFPASLSFGSISGNRTPRSFVTFGLETDLDLSAVDLSLLDCYNTRNPFEFDTLTISTPLFEPPDNIMNSYGINDKGDSYSPHRRIWRFVPTSGDHGFCEHDNLLLPPKVASHPTPESLVEPDSRSTPERLDLSSRDKILSIAVGQLKHPISRAVSSFPSVELLDSLIQYYLTAPFSTGNMWFHRASFTPKTLRPELLLAMAAAGAVLTPDSTLRKLGFAMQEVVRHQLQIIFEDDNTLIRETELHQAYLLNLEVAIWSGNSRKMEIAESFLQPILTMIRRGGMLHHSSYPAVTVHDSDHGTVLEEKWMAWVKQESAKRMAYHVLKHDAQSSMGLLINPLISYAEFCVPLPASPRLWTAASAQEWKEVYLQENVISPSALVPTLVDCVANFDILESNRSVSDMNISCAAVLHAIWGMVWEYRRLKSLLGSDSRHWDNGLLMTSRYQELSKILGYFRIACQDQSRMLLDVISMHMHVSLEEIQILATLDDPIKALQSQQSSSIMVWSKGKDARQAIWHAGQVIRHVKTLPPQVLRDFIAVVLYHASLVLWTYGLSLLVRNAADQPFEPHLDRSRLDSLASVAGIYEQENACLDGEETEDIRRYISLERGVPALRGAQPETALVLLDDPRAVLGVVLTVMEDNFPVQQSVKKPPLVVNLIHLIEKVREVTRY